MSTIYVFHTDTPAIDTGSVLDVFPIFDTSAGRTKNITGTLLQQVVLGGTDTGTVGFYGKAPVAQATGAALAPPASTAGTSTNAWGFTTSTQANAISAFCNALAVALGTTSGVGLIKGAA